MKYNKFYAFCTTKILFDFYTKEGRMERISVPVHANKPLKLGLAKAMMKIAGIIEDD